MKEFFVLLFLISVLTSLIITIVAIFQILTNEFSESKVKWIVISMIGIIGPILYLIEGRKYIVKNKLESAIISDNSSIFSWRDYYFGLIKNLNKTIKLLFLLSFSLIMFGTIVRTFNISFFWESKQIGFFLLGILLAFFFRLDVKKRKELKIKYVFSQIAFWIIPLVLIFQHLTLVIYPNTDAYSKVVDFIKTSEAIEKELGKVNGFTILPTGSFHKVMNGNSTSGIATFVFIVKGEIQFKEIEFVIEKKTDLPDWEVVGFE